MGRTALSAFGLIKELKVVIKNILTNSDGRGLPYTGCCQMFLIKG